MGTKRIWEILPNIFAAVRRSHEEVGLVGAHDFVHAARVGEIAYQIALDEWNDEQLALLAGAAGLCHNDDRILQQRVKIGEVIMTPDDALLIIEHWISADMPKAVHASAISSILNSLKIGRRDVPKEKVAELVHDQLSSEDVLYGHIEEVYGHVADFSSKEKEAIVNAVLKHDGRNGENDSKVLIALMDADRVVNLDIDHFARCGQHYHNIPAVDYKQWLGDPEADYYNPKSVLYDIACSLEWVNPKTVVCVRTRMGKKLAEERAVVYKTFFDVLELQLRQEGIRPYPFG